MAKHGAGVQVPVYADHRFDHLAEISKPIVRRRRSLVAEAGDMVIGGTRASPEPNTQKAPPNMIRARGSSPATAMVDSPAPLLRVHTDKGGTIHPLENQDVSPVTEEKQRSEEDVWKDWSGRGQHANFRADEQVPLEPGDVLGQGSQGIVRKTICKGIVLAWKAKVYPPQAELKMLKEKDILMRLDHAHAVRLVGTYEHQKPHGRVEVGLLTYPVAVCDLADFLTDVDYLTKPGEPRYSRSLDVHRKQRLESLGFDVSGESGTTLIQKRMFQSFGCLASAMAYLHSKGVRHKDLKPANILVYRDGIRLTDFGNSTDFSELTRSTTDNGGPRGSPKYFSPEAANWSPTGRPSDIFSLGCVFLEMVYSASTQTSLQVLDQLRPEADASGRSYQANLAKLPQWTHIDGAGHLTRHLLCDIRAMLARDKDARPTAADLSAEFGVLGRLSYNPQEDLLYGSCCSHFLNERMKERLKNSALEKEIHGLKSELTKSYNSVNRLVEKNDHLDLGMDNLKFEYDKLEKLTKDREMMNTELRTSLEATTALLATTQTKLHKKESELDECETNIENLQKTLGSYMNTSSENNRLKKTIAEKEANFKARLKKERDAHEDEIRQLDSLRDDMEREWERKTQDVAESWKEYSQKLELKFQMLKVECNSLQKQLGKMSSELETSGSEIKRAHEEREQMAKIFATWKDGFNTFEAILHKPAPTDVKVAKQGVTQAIPDSNADNRRSLSAPPTSSG